MEYTYAPILTVIIIIILTKNVSYDETIGMFVTYKATYLHFVKID